ncbi:MAG: GTP 3',8-cyclase MoaA [Bacteroidetes bacterium]|nr:GTP 3',8-cyclase MoaA [Bacteroidota bacterium]
MDKPFFPPEMTTLADTFGRVHSYLRVSVTERCNLRCQYCMPEEGVPLLPHSEILSFEEIATLVSWLASAGVRKVRITGGEPTVRKNLPDLFSMLNRIPGIETLSMTTNGILLADQLPELVKNGLKQINISLDTLSPEKFKTITRRDGLDRVLNSIQKALDYPELEVKINAVAMAGVNDDEFADLVNFFKDMPVELRFIEFMPFSGNGWNRGGFISKADQMKLITTRFPLIHLGFNESGTGTANRYQVQGHPLKIGFIASMSENFCSTCSRIRLTAEGSFKSCLFENEELDLKTPLRAGISKNDFLNLISDRIKEKKKQHGGMDGIASNPGRPMVAIGG